MMGRPWQIRSAHLRAHTVAAGGWAMPAIPDG